MLRRPPSSSSWIICVPMALAERADEIVRGLPRDWERARIQLTLEEPADADRAALVLAPASPGRSGSTFILHVTSDSAGDGTSPGLTRRVLARLDEAGIRGRLRLVDAERSAPAPVRSCRRPDTRGRGTADACGFLGCADAPPAVRLERLVRRGGARLERLPRPGRAAPRAGQPCPRRRPELSVSRGEPQGLRRRAGHGKTGVRATRRRRPVRTHPHPPRPLRHELPVTTQGPVWRVDGRAV